MRRLATLLLLITTAVAWSASAAFPPPVIEIWRAASFPVRSGEHFITISGTGLSVPNAITTVVYSGPAGTIELQPSAASYTRVTVWVPQEIINLAGVYSIRVRVTTGTSVVESNSWELDIVEQPGAVLHLPPSTIIQQATSKAGANVSFTVTASSFVDGSPLPVTCDHQSGDLFPFGSTSVRCSTTDVNGHVTEGLVGILVVDFVAPKLTLPADIQTQATSASGAVVSYTVTATDAVDGALTPSCTPPSGSLFPIGTTTVHCKVADTHLNAAAGDFRVVVTDTTPPPPVDTTPPVIIGISASPDVLTPPNHKLVAVQVHVEATDESDPAPSSRIVGVTASEPLQPDDWHVTGPLTVELRAERSGQADRLYTIAVETSDRSGNVAQSSVTVLVPHDQSNDEVVPPPPRRRSSRH
jgi:hypothetical protein